MIESSCHCGVVKLEIQSAREEVNDCNCSICRRYGALWAYYRMGVNARLMAHEILAAARLRRSDGAGM
jgi:hypothetical protein